ncbi:hypothetical protein [Nostoc sp.]|uniref:hypothetical protein n=1 Tax=Nostoc sp. TaxID=1180 RepID=UPI002FF6B158
MDVENSLRLAIAERLVSAAYCRKQKLSRSDSLDSLLTTELLKKYERSKNSSGLCSLA